MSPAPTLSPPVALGRPPPGLVRPALLGLVVRRMRRRVDQPAALLAIVFAGTLTACAAQAPHQSPHQAPQGIRTPLPQAPTVAAAQRDAEAVIGERVRWGGTVLEIHNGPRQTEVRVLARPLGQGGRPRATAPGEGRFIAVIPGFVDPAALPPGQLLTVLGPITAVRTEAVGEFPYRHPVVAVEQRQDWAAEPPVRDWPSDPWARGWCGPGFGPWSGRYGPWGPWGPWGGPWGRAWGPCW